MAPLEHLEPRTLLAGDLLIAEVMTSNDQTIKDEDGSYSDWLEVYNASQAPVDLTGWHLTDRINDRTQWTFEGGSLDPGESLLVFASGKDRRDVDQELHTNFRLVEGEYLALFYPDGRTPSDEYLALPPQYTDVSYGVEQALADRSLVDEGSTVRALFPASGAQDLPAATWTASDFDDSAWSAFTLGLGYDDDPADGDFNPLIHADGNVSQMQGQTASAYVRSEFEIAGDVMPTYQSLDLNINYDDGFVAYLNGQEIARASAPETLAWDSVATEPHGGIAAVADYPDFTDADDRDDYTLLGNAAWEADRLQLTQAQVDQVGAAWLTQALPFGADYTFSARMTFDIHTPGGNFADLDGRGGEGLTFVLQANDNNVLGSGGGGLGIDNTGSTFLAIELDSVATGSFDPDDDLPSHLGVDTSAVGNLARVAIPRFNGDGFEAGEPGPGVNLWYLWVDYTGETQQLDVYLADADSKPADPTLSTTVDLQELFGEIPELWAGWTSSTGDAYYNAHDVLNWNIVTGIGEVGRDPVSLDVSQFVGALQTGTNVLAVHGLNVDAGDEDFLLIPRLSGEEVVLGELQFFSEPTPGDVNGVGDLAPSGGVSFSVTDPVFVDPFTVEIVAAAPSATIRYTLDGTLPDETSAEYTGVISVDGPMRIRARAFEPDRGPGPITSVGYVQLDSSLTDFENDEVFNSNLPLVVFDSFGNSRVDTDSTRLVAGTVVFIDPGEDGRASLLDEPEYFGRAGMRIRGQSSQGWPKKQYALEIWEEGNDDSKPVRAYEAEDKDVSIFGLPAESDWVLNGPYSDKTQLNNYLTFLWSNEMGLYAPRARLVEVFVNRRDNLDYADDYRGTYVLMEKIKIDQNRTDITPLEPGDNAEPDITGGYIWKKDKSGAGERPFHTAHNREQRLVDPSDPPRGLEGEPGYVTPEQKEWLINHIEEFEDVLYGSNFADPKEGYAKYIDVDSWVDTWLLVEFTKNIDGFRLSTYYHKDLNGKIKQGPAWDYNLSLGNANYLEGAYPEGWYGALINSDQYPYWSRLFEDPNFEQKVADRWQELRQTIWSTEKILADIDAAVAQLSDGNPNLENPAPGEPSNPISRNFDRWTRGGYGLGSYHWPNCFFGQGGCPASPLPNDMSPNGRPNSYDDYIYIMKWFAENRAAWIDTQFTPPVNVSPPGGVVPKPTEVTISGPVQYELYYTLDGSDPRQPLVIEEEQTVLFSGAPAQVLVPADGTLIGHCDDGLRLENPEACFINPDYVVGHNGETWATGTTPVGYDTEGDYSELINTDVADVMKDVNSSVYVRIPLEIDDQLLSDATSMKLRVRHDDGFVAYLWLASLGTPVEIARDNAPGTARRFPINELDFNAAATETHPDEQAVLYEDFDVTAAINWIRSGQNYLVFQALNESADSTDFLLDVELVIGTTRIEVSPSVLRYTEPFTVDKNSQVIARGFNPRNDEWTGRAKVLYVVDTPTVAITEVNYNPYDPTGDELLANPQLVDNDFEFVEIQNVGASTVDLIGASFVGFDFTFPSTELAPGEHGVVVKDLQAFQLRYGSDVRVLGEFFGGSLNNAGERLQLLDAAGQVLIDFTYDDSALWPERADGSGGTLQLIDPAFTPADGYSKYFNWRGSTEFGGSPGRAGAPPVGVVINEVLSHTDAPVQQTDSIELLNVTGEPIDLGDWYLSDAGGELLKYQIPRGTVLGPGEYLVLNESHFNANPEDPLSFALSGTNGDDVWLTLADAAGRVTAFVDDVHFGAALNGEPFGRLPNGTGRLAPMQTVTLGAVNGDPRVGPVVITEVQYNPDDPTDADKLLYPEMTSGDLEYIEIHNPTGEAVNLTDWRIRGGVDYNFYPDEMLGAGETILVTRFDPTDPARADRLAAFRNHYGMTGEERIVTGGFGQQLSGSGERVTLLSADLTPVDPPQPPPRVQQDEIVYDDGLPWPTQADGSGKSLNRLGPTLFGNDPNSWTAANPTPGSARFEGLPGDFNGSGAVDVTDVNLLFEQMRLPAPDMRFDLTEDGLVNRDDRDVMIQEILGTSYGDADLNGTFNSSDFVRVFQVGEYEDGIEGNSTWEDGDWDGDGEFDATDMLVAFQGGGYVYAALPVLASRAAGTPAVASALEADRALSLDSLTESTDAESDDVLQPVESSVASAVAAQAFDGRDSVFDSDDFVDDDLLTEDLLDELLLLDVEG